MLSIQTVDNFSKITYNIRNTILLGGDNSNMTQLNENQKKFCEEYIKNGFNGSKAYSIAYSNENKNVCNVEAYKLLRDPRIQDHIKEVEGSYRIVGHKLGINKKLIMETIKNQLKATKPIVANGEIVDQAPDNTAINNAITTYAKLTGDFAVERKSIEIEERLSDIDIKSLNTKEREELKAKILSEL